MKKIKTVKLAAFLAILLVFMIAQTKAENDLKPEDLNMAEETLSDAFNTQNDKTISPNDIAKKGKNDKTERLTVEEKRLKLVDVKNQGFEPSQAAIFIVSLALLAIIGAPTFKKCRK